MNRRTGWLRRLGAVIAASCLTGVSAAELLTIRPKPPQAIEVGEAIPISVSVGATAATDVKAGTVDLNLKGNGRSIAPLGLTLCPSAAQCDGKALTLKANMTHTLWLHGAQHEGVYEGSVKIDHADSAAGSAALATTVYVSSPQAKAIGVALIAFAVLFAFGFTVVLRYVANRKSLLIAPGVVRDAVHALRARVHTLAPPMLAVCQPTVGQIDKLLVALALPTLEANGLPMSWATPLSDANLAGYKAYVSAQALKAQALKVVVEEGLFEIAALVQSKPNAFQPADVQAALVGAQAAARYDGGTPPSEELVRQAVHAAVKTLADKGGAKNLAGGSWTPVGRGFDGPRQLQLQVANLNRAMWVTVLILTTGVGAALLVLTGANAAGFGTTEDFVRCVLWGLGLSAGSQLTSASTSTVMAAFAVPKPL